jgi:hypothetical protein
MKLRIMFTNWRTLQYAVATSPEMRLHNSHRHAREMTMSSQQCERKGILPESMETYAGARAQAHAQTPSAWQRKANVRAAHSTPEHDMTRHDTTRHDTTRHDTTRHDTTRHDTTRHDTTHTHINVHTPSRTYVNRNRSMIPKSITNTTTGPRIRNMNRNLLSITSVTRVMRGSPPPPSSSAPVDIVSILCSSCASAFVRGAE